MYVETLNDIDLSLYININLFSTRFVQQTAEVSQIKSHLNTQSYFPSSVRRLLIS